MTVFEYDNICHIGGNPRTSVGINSNAERKLEACLNFKEIVESPLRNVIIYDGRLILEMEQYERKSRPGRSPVFGNTAGHDDMMTSAIWAFYILKTDLIEQYYEVKKFVMDKLGNAIPAFILSTESQADIDEEVQRMMSDIDDKFVAISSKSEISLNQLEARVKESQADLMKNFLMPNRNQEARYADTQYSDENENEDEESFIGGFIG